MLCFTHRIIFDMVAYLCKRIRYLIFHKIPYGKILYLLYHTVDCKLCMIIDTPDFFFIAQIKIGVQVSGIFTLNFADNGKPLGARI